MKEDLPDIVYEVTKDTEKLLNSYYDRFTKMYNKFKSFKTIINIYKLEEYIGKDNISRVETYLLLMNELSDLLIKELGSILILNIFNK